MRHQTFYFVIIVILFTACTESAKQASAQKVERDKSINQTNSYTEVFFDSSSMEKFIASAQVRDSSANRLRSFYNSRNYQFAWFFDEGIADYASTFLQMQNNYILYSGDSNLYN